MRRNLTEIEARPAEDQKQEERSKLSYSEILTMRKILKYYYDLELNRKAEEEERKTKKRQRIAKPSFGKISRELSKFRDCLQDTNSLITELRGGNLVFDLKTRFLANLASYLAANLINLWKLGFRLSDFEEFYQSQKEFYKSQKISSIGDLLPDVIIDLLGSFEAEGLIGIFIALCKMGFKKEQLGFSDDELKLDSAHVKLKQIADQFLPLIDSEQIDDTQLSKILYSLSSIEFKKEELGFTGDKLQNLKKRLPALFSNPSQRLRNIFKPLARIGFTKEELGFVTATELNPVKNWLKALINSRPAGQNLANILKALARMGFTKEELGLARDHLQIIKSYFINLPQPWVDDQNPDNPKQKSDIALDISVILHALASMGYDNSEINIKEAITNYLTTSVIEGKFALKISFMLLHTHQIQDLLGRIKDSPAASLELANPGDRFFGDRFFLTEERVKQIAGQYKINLQEAEIETVQKARFSTSETQKDFCSFLRALPEVTDVSLKYPLYQVETTEHEAVTVTATDIKVDYKDHDTQQIRTCCIEIYDPLQAYRNYQKNSVANILIEQMLQEIASRNSQDGNPIMVFNIRVDQIEQILAAEESFAGKPLIEILETAPGPQKQKLEKKEAKQEESKQKANSQNETDKTVILSASKGNPEETTSDTEAKTETKKSRRRGRRKNLSHDAKTEATQKEIAETKATPASSFAPVAQEQFTQEKVAQKQFAQKQFARPNRAQRER